MKIAKLSIGLNQQRWWNIEVCTTIASGKQNR